MPKREYDAALQRVAITETAEERQTRKAAAKAAKRLKKANDGQTVVTESVKSSPITNSTQETNNDREVFDMERITRVAMVDPSMDSSQPLPLKSVEDQLKTHIISKQTKMVQRTEHEEMFSGLVMDITPPSMKVEDSVRAWGLTRVLADTLTEDRIAHFFPVQRAVIPLLLKRSCSSVQAFPRDICASAATGSGKTLAYALPVVQNLMTRKFVRLRALVILPSQELCAQVYKVFCRLGRKTSLLIAVASGQNAFSLEQEMLVEGIRRKVDFTEALEKKKKHSYGSSKIDILVCTPGRLLEHLEQTDGFTLQHLQYLILDEADRLLSNAYHHWVRGLLAGWDTGDSPDTMDSSTATADLSFYIPKCPPQRLLFSATLTDNPRKLSLLNIRNPLVLRVGQEVPVNLSTDAIDIIQNSTLTSRYTLPLGLSESICVCDTETRPFLLVSLLALSCGSISNVNMPELATCQKLGSMCLIFASSVETVHRLCVILKLVNNRANYTESDSPYFGGAVDEISSLISPEERKKILDRAAAGDIKILVATDQMARGIDLSNISLVVNYDPPKFSRSYVHRVGRTARAGRVGYCVTMLKVGQVTAFKKIRSEVSSNKRLQKFKLCENEYDTELLSLYSDSLKQFSKVVGTTTTG